MPYGFFGLLENTGPGHLITQNRKKMFCDGIGHVVGSQFFLLFNLFFLKVRNQTLANRSPWPLWVTCKWPTTAPYLAQPWEPSPSLWEMNTEHSLCLQMHVHEAWAINSLVWTHPCMCAHKHVHNICPIPTFYNVLEGSCHLCAPFTWVVNELDGKRVK